MSGTGLGEGIGASNGARGRMESYFNADSTSLMLRLKIIGVRVYAATRGRYDPPA